MTTHRVKVDRAYIENRSMPIPFCGCWIWLRGYGGHGYGCAVRPFHTAHRAAYFAFKGPIPAGMLVQHSCDMHWCVNPDHLSLGTDKSNSDDKIRKGRANLDKRVFPPHPGRKLTVEQIASIRAGTETGTLKQIGARYGVNAAVIRNVRIGRHYRNVPVVAAGEGAS